MSKWLDIGFGVQFMILAGLYLYKRDWSTALLSLVAGVASVRCFFYQDRLGE